MNHWGRFCLRTVPTRFYFFPPLNTLAGRVMIVLRRSKTALTVIPRSRKGKRRSHTIGYRIKANKARGQHKTRRISQRRNFIILNPLYTIGLRDSSYVHIIYTKIFQEK